MTARPQPSDIIARALAQNMASRQPDAVITALTDAGYCIQVDVLAEPCIGECGRWGIPEPGHPATMGFWCDECREGDR